MKNEQKSNNKAMAGFGVLITTVAVFSVYAIMAYNGLV